MSLRIEGLPAGAAAASQVRARFVQFRGPDQEVTRQYPADERATTHADDYFALSEAGGFLPAGQRLRVEVVAYAPEGARVVSAQARVHTLPA